MKFICKKCQKIKNLHKVRLSYINHNLVSKEAYCCDEYMEQVITDEYKGMPEIQRPASDTNHCKPSGDKLWNDAKKGLLDGDALSNE